MPNDVTVHVLKHGLPRCGFSKEVPRDWPRGNVWVATQEELQELPAGGSPCFNCMNLKEAAAALRREEALKAP